MDSRPKKKPRHPLAQTVNGVGHPAFTGGVLGVQLDAPDDVGPALEAFEVFVRRGQAAQAAVDEQLELDQVDGELLADGEVP